MQGRGEIEPLLANIAAAVRGIPENLLFVTCLDASGTVSASDCLIVEEWAIESLASSRCYSLPKRLGASSVIFTLIPARTCLASQRADSAAAHLMRAGSRVGVRVLNVFLFAPGEIVALKGATDYPACLNAS